METRRIADGVLISTVHLVELGWGKYIQTMKQVILSFALLLMLLGPGLAYADDWPEFRGEGRKGEWNETGILEKFPADGLKILWRAPVGPGYSSPTVSNGRIFLSDRTIINGPLGSERAFALDEKTGKLLWEHEWGDVDYSGILWPNGPRATPTVDGDRVYVLGATGILVCLDVETGTVLWKKDYVTDYDAEVTMFGIASAPIIDGPRLIAMVGGRNALAVAFDKFTGEELWRSLETNSDPGMGHPLLVDAGGVRQVIIWSSDALQSLNPETGDVYWRQPFRVMAPMSIPVPVFDGSNILVTNFYTGAMMVKLDEQKPGAELVWQGKSDSEIATDTLHSVIGTPVVVGDHIYGLCSYGQLRCLRTATGERVWESQEVTLERARWASGFIVRNGNRFFISNDRGELMIAKLTPEGYEEISRTSLITPTSPAGVRRQLGKVSVVHPAYANRNIYMRNDEEIICASLAADDS
jgi:outer membrane protein assembly factor BamB